MYFMIGNVSSQRSKLTCMLGFNSDDSYLRLVYLYGHASLRILFCHRYVEMVVADLGIGSFITFCACASPELGLGQGKGV